MSKNVVPTSFGILKKMPFRNMWKGIFFRLFFIVDSVVLINQTQ
jgi:hypothetical protein